MVRAVRNPSPPVPTPPGGKAPDLPRRSGRGPAARRRDDRGGFALATVLLGQRGEARARLLRELARDSGRRPFVVKASDPLFPTLDVAGNVGFPLRARRLPVGEQARIGAELLALVGLERDGRRQVATLDRGERALLLLARGLATDPAVLLMDDPADGLTPPDRERLFAAVRRVIRLGRADVIVATGDRVEAFALGDTIVVMDGERIVATGTVDALIADPGSAAVARAITDANILVARVEPDPADPDDADARLPSGQTMPARLAPGVGPGDLCLLAIPPGRIAFAAVPASRMGDAALPATLIEHRHFGTHLRLRLRLEDGTPIIVHRPPGSLSARDASTASNPGGAALAWRAGDATAFPHPDA